MPGNVNVVRPDGSVTSLPLEQAKRLEILGYKIEEDEEASVRSAGKITAEHYNTPQQRVQAGLEGVVSGATLGLSDLGDGIEERGRAAAHPGTRLTGEVIGAFIPDLLSFGAAAPVSGAELGATGIRAGARAIAEHTPAGLASRAGRTVEESVGGFGGAVAGTAVQGGLQGAGAAITNAKLSGDPVTAESVLAGAGMGALIGGGTGGIGYSATKLTGRVAESVVPGLVKGERTTADEAIDSVLREERHADLQSRFDTAADAENAVNSLVDEAKDAKYTDLHLSVKEATHNIDSAVVNIERELDTAIANIGSVGSAEKTPMIAPLTREGRALIDSVDSVGIPSKITGTVKKVARENGIAILETDTAESIINKLKQKGEAVEAQASKKLAGGGNVHPDAAALTQLKGALNAKTAEDVEERLSNYKILKSTSFPPDVSRAVSKAQEMIRLKRSAELLQDFPTSLKEFRSMKGSRLEKMLAALDSVGNRPEFRAIDTGLASTLEELGIKVAGSPAEKARALWETKNISAVNSGAEKLKVSMPKVESAENLNHNTKSSNFWSRAIRSVGARGTSSVARKLGLGFVGGGVGYELGGNLTSGLIGASLFTGVSANREGVVGRVRSAAAHYVPAAGRVVKNIAPRLAGLTIRIDGTIDSEKDQKKQLLNRLEEIRTVGPGFNDSAFKIIEPMVGHQDEFGGQFVKSASTAFGALQQYIPKDPGLAFSRGKSLWNPTDLQIRLANKILAAYHDPVGTIEHIVSSGNLDTVVVKFIKDAFPGLYGEFQSAMIQKIAEPGVLSTMNENDQAHVGILIGIPLHSSHTPRSIAYTQTMYAKIAEAAAANKPDSGGGGHGGRPAKSEPPTAAQSLIQV